MIPRQIETEILRLYQIEHWVVGTIAAQLRIHHSTVSRVLARAGMPVPDNPFPAEERLEVSVRKTP